MESNLLLPLCHDKLNSDGTFQMKSPKISLVVWWLDRANSTITKCQNKVTFYSTYFLHSEKILLLIFLAQNLSLLHYIIKLAQYFTKDQTIFYPLTLAYWATLCVGFNLSKHKVRLKPSRSVTSMCLKR